MNFRKPPHGAIEETNQKEISSNELQDMTEYFDELISLRVLKNETIKCLSSVFTVNKPELDVDGNHLL